MAAGRSLTVGQAVHFRYVDPIFGTDLEQAGIVVAVADDEVTVAPVAPFTITASADDVEPLTAPAAGSTPAAAGSAT